MKPELVIENGNVRVDIWNHGGHYAIMVFENNMFRYTKVARDLEEAKVLAERYVGPSTPTFLTE